MTSSVYTPITEPCVHTTTWPFPAPVYVLFHGPGCQDGLGSKYAAWCKFGDEGATYIPVAYGDKLPDMVEGSEVYIIDFSYPKDVLEMLHQGMARVVVLDHHKSAEEALKGLDFAFFDMSRSGAVMAWNYFHPDTEVPEVLKRVQDRDLWRWQYRDTKAVTSAVQLLGGDMAQWQKYVELESEGLGFLVNQGEAIENYKNYAIERACRDYQLTFRVWKSHKVAIINSNGLQSDIGAHLYDKYPVDYVIIYSLNGAGLVNIGLRSKNPTGADVSEVAKIYGGGGHKHSAGCSAPTSIIHEWYSSPFFLVS